MKIELDLYLLIYIAVMISGVILVLSTDDTDTNFGSPRLWACLVYIIFAVVFTLVYGGFVWW